MDLREPCIEQYAASGSCCAGWAGRRHTGSRGCGGKIGAAAAAVAGAADAVAVAVEGPVVAGGGATAAGSGAAVSLSGAVAVV